MTRKMMRVGVDSSLCVVCLFITFITIIFYISGIVGSQNNIFFNIA